MFPILAILTDTHPAPVIRALQFRDPTAPAPVAVPLGDSTTLLVTGAAGAQLALRYLPLSALLRLLRQGRLMSELWRLRERSPWPTCSSTVCSSRARAAKRSPTAS